MPSSDVQEGFLTVVFPSRYHMEEPPDKKFGSKNADGSWNGMIGMLVRKVSICWNDPYACKEGWYVME